MSDEIHIDVKLHRHGYLGFENQATYEMMLWMDARAYRNEVRDYVKLHGRNAATEHWKKAMMVVNGIPINMTQVNWREVIERLAD